MSFATRSGGYYVPYLFQLRQESQLESDRRAGRPNESEEDDCESARDRDPPLAFPCISVVNGLTNKLTNELPVARAYACDVGDPADDMVAQRSVTASLFAVAA
jgi:hypothetical protein